MLKLKKHVIEFLEKNVKQETLGKKLQKIYEYHSTNRCARMWHFIEEDTIKGVAFSLHLNRFDFEEVEELKPYVWYPREKFDGNPKKYWILEHFDGGCCELYKSPESLDNINQYTTHFMYIEPFEEQDHDAS